MTHITKFKPHAYYLAANFFFTLLDVKLNFCLNHRTPSHLTSMEGTREKTQCLELSICSLYLSFYFYKGPTLLPSRWMNQLGTMQLAIDRERH